MALTPLDIHHKEFKPARFGGYKEEEVDSFLDQIADELEKLILENVDLKQQIEHSKKRLSEFEEMQTSLQSALLAATKSAEAVKEQAKQESEMMLSQARETADSITTSSREEADSEIRNAQEQARQMLLRAQSERQKLEKGLARLKEVKRSYVQSIRDLADAHLERISEIESDEDMVVMDEIPEPEPVEKDAAMPQEPAEKLPIEKPQAKAPAVESSQIDAPPVINQQPGTAGAKAMPVEPPVTPPDEPPAGAKVKPDAKAIETTDRPVVIEPSSTTVQKTRTEMSAAAPPVEVKKPAAGAPPESAVESSMKNGATAVSVKEEPAVEPPPSSSLVEEVLSMEGDEGIFGDLTEDGNGSEVDNSRKGNRKEKRDKHFFWE